MRDRRSIESSRTNTMGRRRSIENGSGKMTPERRRSVENDNSNKDNGKEVNRK